MVVVRNSCHYGIAGYYTTMATKAGCIGMTGTNARPSVAPTHGVEDMFGTNPTPETMPDVAKVAGTRVVVTGHSDFTNQINNVLAFHGIFRGALDCRAFCINEEMKVATSYALASLIPDDEISEDNIIAPALNKR